jgi:hypothetical protein
LQVTRRSDKEQNRFGSTWSTYRRGRGTCTCMCTCFKRLREVSRGLQEASRGLREASRGFERLREAYERLTKGFKRLQKASTEFHYRRVFHRDVLTVTGQSRYIIIGLGFIFNRLGLDIVILILFIEGISIKVFNISTLAL